ncbi:HlyC/CorC family transporter [Oceanobacillus piezotolerans]|uniref:HlyC/CorC family transporter n=1 Tax=Oceanobacillus piezotolerans TaxID=2448030 RepID=A0A498D6B4_9BACI|nr:hemolysin family protein [Oceanobacillus piezotolerans]RLL40597.1 HlyC/CorC family transporter [Oceanobacillus piezotolerans]
MDIFNLTMVAILILISSFFVAAEFAIVRMRRSKVDQLVAQGKPGARAVDKVISDLDGYLAACQLGITVTSLGIGWLGEPAVAHLIEPVFASLGLSEVIISTLSFIVGFGIITFLHVVIGELAPKSFSIQKTEAVSLLVSPVLIIFNKIMYPFIWALNGASRFLVGLFGLPPATESGEVYSEEEVRSILSTSYKSGEISSTEIGYLNNVFDFDERVAKEVMVPRTEIVCIYNDNTYEENVDILKKEKYTRYPVAEEDKDRIIGVINTKELFHDFLNESQKEDYKEYIKPIVHVAESIPVNEVLKKMQKEHSYMAIVVDEYGGTAGLLTVEDIIEEIFGDIHDELDIDEKPMFQRTNKDTFLLNGKLLIKDTNELLGTEIDDEELDTIGGWAFNQQAEVQVGTTIEYDNYLFTVKKVNGYQIKLIEAKQLDKKDNLLSKED